MVFFFVFVFVGFLDEADADLGVRFLMAVVK